MISWSPPARGDDPAWASGARSIHATDYTGIERSWKPSRFSLQMSNRHPQVNPCDNWHVFRIKGFPAAHGAARTVPGTNRERGSGKVIRYGNDSSGNRADVRGEGAVSMRMLLVFLIFGLAGCVTGPYALQSDLDALRNDLNGLVGDAQADAQAEMQAEVQAAQALAAQANAAAQDALEAANAAQASGEANTLRLERMFEASQQK